MRYVTFRFEDHGEIVAVVEREEFVKQLPVESMASVWKQEVYFSTDIELEGEATAVVEPGTVAYWPPGKALCLFYGISQPYSPVIKLGTLLGPLYYLAWVDEGESVEVVEYRDYGRAGELASRLRDKGLLAAARSWEDTESVIVLVKGVRAEIYIEDYGFPLESDALFINDNTALTRAFLSRLSKLAAGLARLDINEEGHVIFSAFAKDEEELIKALEDVAACWRKAQEELGELPCLPSPKTPPRG